jgi:hypothetical protein
MESKKSLVANMTDRVKQRKEKIGEKPELTQENIQAVC